MGSDYVHGYSQRESKRLYDQAGALVDLHGDTIYQEGSMVLEAGCGVGAQTKILAKNSPEAEIVSVDISAESIGQARALLKNEKVSFQVADIFHLPFKEETFDHVFVCFVLEHLKDPIGALGTLKRVLKKRGTITVIEGDHGSAFFYPESREAAETIRCLINLQAERGGDAKIGRRLYPLLISAGYEEVRVSPRVVYADGSRPDLEEGFIKKTFTAMVEEIEGEALERKMIDDGTWRKGIQDLYRTAEADGTFSYTFFKAVARK